MNYLQLKAAADCRYDEVSLGEVMLRLDPGDDRIRNARSFRAWEGGGEYNVARGLRKCFGLRTAIVTALASNDVGYLIEDMMLQGGVDTSLVQWKPFDGIGRKTRNGLNFTERGFGVRGALGVSDRAATAASQMQTGDVDWEDLFARQGVRWFHTGGIYAALSETTAQVVLDAMRAAKKHGTIISYDLNYRPSLWRSIGGKARAQAVNREIAEYVDVMIGNEEDFTACLGFEIDGNDENLKELNLDGYARMIAQVSAAYPNLKAIATTLRTTHSASHNGWKAIAWQGCEPVLSSEYDLDIYDRVGGGDSFASGLVYGLLQTGDIRQAAEYGAAHGALAMTTPGDTSMARQNEVEALMRGGSARVQR